MTRQQIGLHAPTHLPAGQDPLTINGLGGAPMPYAHVAVSGWSWTQPGATFVSFSGGSGATTDTDVFTIDLTGTPTSPITIISGGRYIIAIHLGPWDGGAWGTNARIDLSAVDLWTFSTASIMASTQFPLTYTPVSGNPYLSLQGVHVEAGTGPFSTALRIQAQQSSGANRTVDGYIFAMQMSVDTS